MATQGGTHEQHVKAGQQSHKNQNEEDQTTERESSGSAQRGGTHEQHAKAGQQSHKKS